MGKAQFMEAVVRRDYLGRDPGRLFMPSDDPGAGCDNLIEGGIHCHPEYTFSDCALQPS